MEKSQLFMDKELKQKVLELSTLYEISKIVSSTLDLAEVAAGTLKLLSEFLGLNRGGLTLMDESRGELTIRAAYGMKAEEILKGKYKLGEGVTGKVVEIPPEVLRPLMHDPMAQARPGIERGSLGGRVF